MASSARNIGIGINIDPQDLAAIQQLINALNHLKTSAGSVGVGSGAGARPAAAGGTAPPGGGGSPGSAAGGPSSAQASQQAAQATKEAEKSAKGLGSAMSFMGAAQKKAMELAEGIATIGKALDGVKEISGVLQGAFGGFYEATIGANEKLNQEILKTQANLAATSKVMMNGQTLKGADSVRATASSLQDALRTLEKETMSLVGVTSEDVNGVFNTVLSNVSAITGQSKEYENAIKSSIPLAKSMTAAIGVMGLRLDEVGQEFGSLVKAEITEDSRLAKGLGINNAMVRQWRAQGKAVDEILERLKPFVDSNAMAARSVAGITSNIQDIFQILSREAGKPLLEPLVGMLEKTFEVLNSNKDTIINFFGGFGRQVGAIAEQLERSLGPAVGMMVEAFGNMASSMGGVFRSLLETVKNLIPAIAPLATAISALLLKVSEFANTEFGQFLLKGLLAKMLADSAIDKFSGSIGGLTKSFGELIAMAGSGKLQRIFDIAAAGKLGLLASMSRGKKDKDGNEIPGMSAGMEWVAGMAGASHARGAAMISKAKGIKAAGVGASLAGGAAQVIPGIKNALGGAKAGATAGMAAGLASMKAGLASMVPLLQTLGTTLLGMLPVIAAIGVAGGIAFAAWKAQDMKRITGDMDRSRAATDRVSEANFKLANQIKHLSNIKKFERDLTDEEIKQLEKLQWQNNVNAQAMAIRIENAKSYAATLSGDRRAEMEAQIASMEREYAALSSLNTLDVSFKDLLDLGPVAEQLSFQIEGAFQKVREGVQTSDELAQHYKTIMELSQQQFGMGLLSVEEYRDRMIAVTQDTSLSSETIREAFKQLNEIDAQVQERAERSADAAIAELERQVTLGQLTQVEGAKELADVRMDKLQDKLDSLNKRINEQASQIATMLGEEKIRLTERKGELQAAIGGQTLTTTDRTTAETNIAEAKVAKEQAEAAISQFAEASVNDDNNNPKEVTKYLKDRDLVISALALLKGEEGSAEFTAELDRLKSLDPDALAAEAKTNLASAKQNLTWTRSSLVSATDLLRISDLDEGTGAYKQELALRGETFTDQVNARDQAAAMIASNEQTLAPSDGQPDREQQKTYQKELAEVDKALAEVNTSEDLLGRAKAVQDDLYRAYAEGATGSDFDKIAAEAVAVQSELAERMPDLADPALIQEFQQTGSEIAQEMAEAPSRIAQAMIETFDRGQARTMADLQKATAAQQVQITEAIRSGAIGEGGAAELQTAAQQKQLQLAEQQAKDKVGELRRIYSEYSALTESERKNQQDKIVEAETALSEATQQRMEYEGQAVIEIAQGYLAELERGQQAATLVLRKAQAEREAIVTEMIHGFQLLESEAEGERLRMQRDQLESELDQSAERVAILQRLYDEHPALNPKERAAQLQELTEAQINHANITTGLLNNEGQITDNIVAQEQERLGLLERRVQIEMNLLGRSGEQELMLLDRKAKAHELITHQMDTQVQLYQAQTQLADAQAGAVSGALGILERTARTDRERQRLSQTRALMEVEMAEKRYAMELAMLDLQKKQNDLALARKEIESQRAMQQASNERRGAIQERFSLTQRQKQIENDPTMSEEERSLALGELDQKLFENQGRMDQSQFALADAAMGMQLLDSEKAIIDAQYQAQRQQTEVQGRNNVMGARVAYGESLGAQGRSVLSAVRQDQMAALAAELGLSPSRLVDGLNQYNQAGKQLYGRGGRSARNRGASPEDLRRGAANLYDSSLPSMPGAIDLSPGNVDRMVAQLTQEIDAEAWDAISRSQNQHRPVVRDQDTERGGQVSTQVDQFQEEGGGGYMNWETGVAGGYGENTRTVEDIMGPLTAAPPGSALAILQGSPLAASQEAIAVVAKSSEQGNELLGQINDNLTKFLTTGGATLETTINNHFAPSAVPEDVEQAVLNANYEILSGLLERRGFA